MPQSQNIKVSFESTPNPSTMKFLFSEALVEGGHEFASAAEAERSPLAAKIFGFPWTNTVYLGPNFVSVTKQDWVDWEILAEPLAGLIQEHLQSELPLLFSESSALSDDSDESDTPVVRQLKHLIHSEIRPVVALDGGDVLFAKYENHILYLHMRGACAGCPSRSATLKEGIEVRIKQVVPEVQEVVSL